MNINKQQTKGNKMKKIAMIIGVLSILATSANAAWISSYSNGMGGYNYYSSGSGYLGSSYSNGLGGTTFYSAW